MTEQKVEFLDLKNLLIAHKACDIELPTAEFNDYFQNAFLVLTYNSPLEREMMKIELADDYDLFNFKIGNQYFGVTDLKEFETSVMENEKTGYKMYAACVPLKEYQGLLYLSKEFNELGLFPVLQIRETATGKFIDDTLMSALTIWNNVDPNIIIQRGTNLLPINFCAYRENQAFISVCFFNLPDPKHLEITDIYKFNAYQRAVEQHLAEMRKKNKKD